MTENVPATYRTEFRSVSPALSNMARTHSSEKAGELPSLESYLMNPIGLTDSNKVGRVVRRLAYETNQKARMSLFSMKVYMWYMSSGHRSMIVDKLGAMSGCLNRMPVVMSRSLKRLREFGNSWCLVQRTVFPASGST